MALRCLGVLISKDLSAGIARRLNTTAARQMLHDSPNAHLNKNLLNRYTRLQSKIDPRLVQATYVWIDGTGENVRCKDRVLDKIPQKPEDCPHWQYDGSSTYQAQGGNSDVSLVPRALYRDPFKAGEKDVIVLCDTYKPDGSPCESNHRAAMQAAYDQTKNEEPWFGIEQEYTFLDVDRRPLGWPSNGFPGPQGPYYCAAGAEKVVGRDIVEAHALACLYSGVAFAGTNAEVMPAQWGEL